MRARTLLVGRTEKTSSSHGSCPRAAGSRSAPVSATACTLLAMPCWTGKQHPRHRPFRYQSRPAGTRCSGRTAKTGAVMNYQDVMLLCLSEHCRIFEAVSSILTADDIAPMDGNGALLAQRIGNCRCTNKLFTCQAGSGYRAYQTNFIPRSTPEPDISR